MIGKVDFLEGFQLLATLVVENAEQQVTMIFFAQNWIIRAMQVTTNPHDGRLATFQMQVAGVFIHQFPKQCVNADANNTPPLSAEHLF